MSLRKILFTYLLWHLTPIIPFTKWIKMNEWVTLFLWDSNTYNYILFIPFYYNAYHTLLPLFNHCWRTYSHLNVLNKQSIYICKHFPKENIFSCTLFIKLMIYSIQLIYIIFCSCVNIKENGSKEKGPLATTLQNFWRDTHSVDMVVMCAKGFLYFNILLRRCNNNKAWLYFVTET